MSTKRGLHRRARPNFFIIGGPKCGTTSLVSWLGQHPDIFIPREKELNFFNSDDYRIITSLDDYEDCFAMAKDKLAIGEATVWYLYSDEAVPNILQYQPDARFIVMFRNPMEMAPALHMEMVISGLEDILDFEDAWRLQGERTTPERLPASKWGARRFQYGAICRLGRQYERLLRQVPSQQILPLALDDVTSDPRAIYLRSLEFLGVADDGRMQFPIENRARRVRWPALNRAQFKYWEYTRNTRLHFSIGLGRMLRKFNIVDNPRPRLSEPLKKELREYFESDVQILQNLLNRDLSHWLNMA